ncbi:hypothetical protein [Rhizobium mongolense]|uniref:Scaffolding protein n=2 Tax=Rhizobium mongolense TaxID=57676 RepID=A0ABR6IQ71_9HYPH|nr:hypothetical protein [Rhizobium mongolense]MBB4230032.1 hypothetical protein [Rhizobium mongolense]TVZ72836.1 hypothetical protein BCL32_1023 [Rhizobium mongolense USDA 1844]
MTDASNSDNGIGLSQNDAASRISGLLDSDFSETADATATREEVNAENETEEVSQPSDDVIENSEEQTLEDSDEPVDAETDEAEETEAAEKPVLADDVEVEVNGQKMSFKELKEGYERTADYTRKTQALKEQVRANDAKVDSIRDQSVQWFHRMEQEIALHLPQEPNWAQLAQDDPAEYIAQQEKWKGIHAQIQRLRNERQLVEQQAAERQEMEFKRALADGQRTLAEMHPELAKPETGKSQALGKYLVDAGIPVEAINRETNPILFSIAYKAMQFDQLQSQKAKAVKVVDEKPLLATPGSSPARSNSSQSVIDRKMGALKRSGSQAAAADVLKHLL